jgi:hypothetical protein
MDLVGQRRKFNPLLAEKFGGPLAVQNYRRSFVAEATPTATSAGSALLYGAAADGRLSLV